ncbi:MAG: Maf family protein [Betaproteobacteria bacterium]
MPAFVYLASQSPRRQELLGQMGVHFKTLLPESNNAKGLNEQLHALELLEALNPAESAVHYVQRVTQLKYQAARLRGEALGAVFVASAPVLCADTTVSLSGRVLGKPKDAQEAQEMIRALSGQTHRVYTSVVIGTPKRHLQCLSRSWVSMVSWSPSQIRAYVASNEWAGKAGAYAIQGKASSMISSIKGSYSGIMGLPVFEVSQMLRSFGLEVLQTPQLD